MVVKLFHESLDSVYERISMQYLRSFFFCVLEYL